MGTSQNEPRGWKAKALEVKFSLSQNQKGENASCLWEVFCSL